MINSKGTTNGGPRRNSGEKKKNGLPFRIIEAPETAAEQAKKKPTPDYMRRQQMDGQAKLKAEEIKQKIDAWLIERGVRQHVPDHLVEMYAMALARYIQTEEEVSKTGFLAKHPTTGAPMTSPYVTMSIEYSKQVQGNWWQIYTTIKEATAGDEKPQELAAPTNSLMDLLAAKRNA
jgi:hypothetical protein